MSSVETVESVENKHMAVDKFREECNQISREMQNWTLRLIDFNISLTFSVVCMEVAYVINKYISWSY